MNNTRAATTLLTLLMAGVWPPSFAADSGPPYCGEEGVWIQILGAGGTEIDDGQAGPSYLVWIDNHARLLVDTASGSAAAYDRSGADFLDLDAIVLTHLHAAHTADLPVFLEGSANIGREAPLPLFGPTGNEHYPDTETFVARLIGPLGAYPYLEDFLTYRSSAGYTLSPRNVPATGRRRWARFGNERLRLAAMPVHHDDAPSIAWRVEVGEQSVVFAGDFSNTKDVIATFAEGADALVVSHAIPENARGDVRDAFATPGQIGRVAARAGVRMLILGHRSTRTRGVESLSRAAIESHYTEPLLFGNDMECWGL